MHVLWVQVAVKGPEVVVRWSNSFRKPQTSHLVDIRLGGLCVTDDPLHPRHAVIHQLCERLELFPLVFSPSFGHWEQT